MNPENCPAVSQEEPTVATLPGAPIGSEIGPEAPNAEAGNDSSYDDVAARAQGDAMQAFLERNYGDITKADAQEGGQFDPDIAQGEAMQAFIETIPASVPTPPPGERGRSVEIVPEAAAADAQKRTLARERQAAEQREAMEALETTGLSQEQAVEVLHDIDVASNIAEQEGEEVARLAVEATTEANVPTASEGNRGYEAYQKKFALELTSEIAKLTPEQRVEAGWKASNLGFQMEKTKNHEMENVFRGAAKTIGGIGATQGQRNFMGRMLDAIGDQYMKKAERNDRTIQSIEKLAKTDRGTGIMTKFSNTGLITGNLNRVAQIAGLSVVPGGAVLALGAMAGASLAEAGKESRLTSESAMEKTRYRAENLTDEEKTGVWEQYKSEHPQALSMTQEEQSTLRTKLENDLAVNKAWDEASDIMETAMKNKSEKLATNILTPEEISSLDPKARAEYDARLQAASQTIDARDLQKAYEERIADTLAARIEKFKDIEPGTNIASRFMTKAATWMMEKAVTSTQKKLEEIENSGLTPEEKNQRREEVMNRFGRGQLMKDIDRMLSQKGALDTMGALLWGAEKTAKAAVVVVSIKNIYDMGQRLLGSPMLISQGSNSRFIPGGSGGGVPPTGGGRIGTQALGPIFLSEENDPVGTANPAQELVAIKDASSVETDVWLEADEMENLRPEADAMSASSVTENTSDRLAQPEDWNTRDGGTDRAKISEQSPLEYPTPRQENQPLVQGDQPPSPRPAEPSVSSVQESYAPTSPHMAHVAEQAPLPAGVPEKYADNPQIRALLARQQIEDRAFDTKWDENLRRAHERAQKGIEMAQDRQARGFTKPFEDAQRDATRGVFNEMGRAVGRGTSKGLGDRIGDVFRREGQDVIRGIGRGVAEIPRNTEAAGKAQERANEAIEKIEKMREAARMAHEIKQAKAIENAIRALERANRT